MGFPCRFVSSRAPKDVSCFKGLQVSATAPRKSKPTMALSENAVYHKSGVNFTSEIRALEIIEAAKPAFSDTPTMGLKDI